MTDPQALDLHLVSDSTGETITSVARACMAQFDTVRPIEHLWPLVRTRASIDKVMGGVSLHPGIVMFTLVDHAHCRYLEERCRALKVPSISVIEPVIDTLSAYLHLPSRSLPGGQHVINAEYLSRIEAMNYVLAHDDGQNPEDWEEAEVILVGVSRTSKTPTSIYLANRGLKAANIPIVPGASLPPSLLALKRPLIVGLTSDPARLVEIRQNRLMALHERTQTDYVSFDAIKQEVAQARRLFTERKWPVIDTTRRSIEETAAAILQLHAQRPA